MLFITFILQLLFYALLAVKMLHTIYTRAVVVA